MDGETVRVEISPGIVGLFHSLSLKMGHEYDACKDIPKG